VINQLRHTYRRVGEYRQREKQRVNHTCQCRRGHKSVILPDYTLARYAAISIFDAEYRLRDDRQKRRRYMASPPLALPCRAFILPCYGAIGRRHALLRAFTSAICCATLYYFAVDYASIFIVDARRLLTADIAAAAAVCHATPVDADAIAQRHTIFRYWRRPLMLIRHATRGCFYVSLLIARAPMLFIGLCCCQRYYAPCH